MHPHIPSPAIVVILAGGKARRFAGQDKGEILIDGKRLIDIIHERLKPQATEIIISGTHDYGLGFTTVPDLDDPPGGPVGGIYSICKSLQSRNVEGFFTVAVDGPNFPDDLTASLYSKTSSTIAVDDHRRHPTYGWWRMVDIARVWTVLDASDSISLNRLAELAGAKSMFWRGREAFTNINRQADLDRFVKGA